MKDDDEFDELKNGAGENPYDGDDEGLESPAFMGGMDAEEFEGEAPDEFVPSGEAEGEGLSEGPRESNPYESNPAFEPDDDGESLSAPGFMDVAEPSGGEPEANGSAGDENEPAQEKPDAPADEALAEPDESAAAGETIASTDDAAEEAAKFEPKMSAEDADKKDGKPRVLNKRLLLGIVVAVFLALMLMTMFSPSKKAGDGAKKKDPRSVSLQDYRAFAKEAPPQEREAPEPEGKGDAGDARPVLVYDEDGVPQMAIYEDEPAAPAPAGTGGGGVSIPDTRNDRLQGKVIAGIKGLTSTQAAYSTEYSQQVEKNVAASAPAEKAKIPSLDEFMQSKLKTYSALQGGQLDAWAMQNDQKGKNDFYNRFQGSPTAGQGMWLGLNTLWQGTIFEAVLTNEVNTDLPGEVTARVAKNIYSSQDGRYLLIPQNSILYGKYNSSISYAQSRAQIVWERLIRPDGYALDLGGQNASDAKGASGVKGFINDHPLAYVKAILLMSVFSAINTEFTGVGKYTDNQYAQNAAANAQQITAQLGEKLIDRAMNVQPTIKIPAGKKINIITNQTFSLPPVPMVPVTQRYIRQ